VTSWDGVTEPVIIDRAPRFFRTGTLAGPRVARAGDPAVVLPLGLAAGRPTGIYRQDSLSCHSATSKQRAVMIAHRAWLSRRRPGVSSAASRSYRVTDPSH